MKKIIVACLVIFITGSKLTAQIGLGITTPHPNAYFQINSTSKGILLPRMTAIQRIAIAPAPTANGLLVFDTDSSAYMYWSGTAWLKISNSNNSELWKQSGNHIYNANTGRVGIGTAAPKAKLHVLDSSVVFSTVASPSFSPVQPPVSGAGTRMMWLPGKAALRTGNVTDNSWDADSIGIYSLAAGYNTKAWNAGSVAFGGSTRANSYSFAAGLSSSAQGYNSTAIGYYANATGDNAAAFNQSTTASGQNSFAAGYATEASGDGSFAAGDHTLAQGVNATAIGHNTHALASHTTAVGENTYATTAGAFAGGNTSSANGLNSFAHGNNALANGEGSFSMGYFSDARGTYSGTIGHGLIAKAQAGIAVGEYNDDTDNPGALPALSDRIFQIGNGLDASSRSNVLTVTRAGNVGINTVNPFYQLDVNGLGHFSSHLITDGNNITSGTLDVVGNTTLHNNLQVNNNTQIGGSTTVGASLHVGDSITTDFLQVLGATPISAGMVLTADVMGNASWQTPGGGLWAANGNDIYNINTGNVGIGNNLPISPLSFASTLGDKISLWGSSTAANYGFGIQAGTLQIHAATPVDNIAFGTGSSTSFAEAMRIQGNGFLGVGIPNPAFRIDVAGRIRIRNEGGQSAGTWHNNTANTNTVAFIGLENDNSVGFYGSGSGWNFTMNTNTGKIKIADGTQAAGRILSCDAAGTASWVNSTAIASAVAGVFAGGGANLTTAASAYLNVYIDLPPGKFIVFATYLLSQGGTGGQMLTGQSMWVRTSFSSSPAANIATGDIVGSPIMSGSIGYSYPFGLVNGQTIINNTSGAIKRYYVWGSMANTGGQPVGFSLDGFGSNFWSENQLTAVPMN